MILSIVVLLHCLAVFAAVINYFSTPSEVVTTIKDETFNRREKAGENAGILLFVLTVISFISIVVTWGWFKLISDNFAMIQAGCFTFTCMSAILLMAKRKLFSLSVFVGILLIGFPIYAAAGLGVGYAMVYYTTPTAMFYSAFITGVIVCYHCSKKKSVSLS